MKKLTISKFDKITTKTLNEYKKIFSSPEFSYPPRDSGRVFMSIMEAGMIIETIKQMLINEGYIND